MKKLFFFTLIFILSNFLLAINKAQIRTTYKNGSTSVQTVSLSQSPDAGAMRVHIPASTIASNVRYIDVVLDTARAVKGEDGYFVLGDSRLGTFKLNDGNLSCNRVVMPIMGMKTPRETWVAIIKGLKYEFSFIATAKYGIYEVYPRFNIEEIRRSPYEDIIVDFYKLSQSANYCDMGKVYRNYQLSRGEVIPLKERVKNNPRLKYTAESMFVRIKNGVKDNYQQIEHQTPENEPKINVMHSFDDFKRIMTRLKNFGLDKVEMCFVGWHSGGFDGRYPDLAPVEEAFGGEAKMREVIELGKSYGYQMTCHVTHTDHYTIGTRFDWNNIALDYKGAYQKHSILPGGRAYYACFQTTHEKIFPDDFEFLKSLGLNGTLHIDVTSCITPYSCFHKDHPCTRQDTADYMNKIAEKAEEHFAGFSSEGPCDHVAKTLDYALYVTAWPKYVGAREDMIDKIIPLWQSVYHGIILSNPYYCTIDYPFERPETETTPYYALKNKTERRLKFFEFGGRLTFYFIDYKNLLPIRDAYKEYQPVKYLQYEFIDDHREVAKNIFTTVYSDGSEILTNYTDSDFEYKGEIVKAQDFRLYKANEVSISMPDTSVYVGEEFEITAVSSKSDIKWKWLKNGEVVKGANSATLKISQYETTATYVAIAQSIGETRSNEIVVNTIQKRLYVSKNGSDENDGYSWNRAFASISKAVEIANLSPNKKVEIWISSGTYIEGDTLNIKSPIEIVGDFIGTESDKQFRDKSNKTILSGNKLYRIINVASGVNEFSCNGIIFKDSLAQDNGGAVYSEALSNAFYNCGFTNNIAMNGGGAIAVVNASKNNLFNCSFSGNTSNTYGGAIHFSGGNTSLSNCSFVENKALNGGGGAIDVGSNAVLTVNNCTIYSNTTNTSGGAIDSWDCSVEVYNSLLCGNVAGVKNNDINAEVKVENVYKSVVSSGANGSDILTDIPQLYKITDAFDCLSVIPIPNEKFCIGKQYDTTPTSDANGVQRDFPCYVGAYQAMGISNSVLLPTNTQTFTLSVNGYTDSSYSYKWYKNGVLIDNQTSSSITLNQTEENATYVCEISTPSKNISQSYNVNVSIPTCVYVSERFGNDAFDGLSAKTPKKTLNTAIDIIGSKSAIIKVESGTYAPSSTISLKGNLKIEGGYDFTVDTSNPSNFGETIIDGKNEISLFNANKISESLVISNMIFTNATTQESGAVITINNSSPHFINCVFKNNYAIWNGACVQILGNSYSKFENCSFENNATQWSSAAVYLLNAKGNVNFTNCSFIENVGKVSSTIHSNNSTFNCVNCTFVNNHFNTNLDTTPTNVDTIVCTKESVARISNCTFVGKNNTSRYAIFCEPSANASVENSIFWDSKNVSTAVSGDVSVSNSVSDKPYSAGVNIITSDPKLSENIVTFGRVKALSIASDGSAAFTGVNTSITPTDDIRGLSRSNPCCIGAVEIPRVNFVEGFNKTLKSGESTTFIALSESTKADSFQWQKLQNNNWIDIVGAKSNTFTILSATTADSSEYRCKVEVENCVLYSDVYKLSVSKGIEVEIPTDYISVKYNETVVLNASASGSNLSYQWQYSADSTQWVDIAGATNANYSFIIKPNTIITGFYRCKVFNSNEEAYSLSTYVSLSEFNVVGDIKSSEYMIVGNLILSDGSSLHVDEDVMVTKILFDSTNDVNASISIDAGKTLYVLSNSEKYLWGDKNYRKNQSKILIDGDGTLNLKNGDIWYGTNADINTDIKVTGTGVQFHYSDVKISKSWVGTRFLNGEKSTITIADGAYVDITSSSYFNLFATTSTFYLGENPDNKKPLAKLLIGKSDNSNGSFYVAGKSYINGYLSVKGQMLANVGSNNAQFCTMYAPYICFYEFAQVEQICKNPSVPVIFSEVISNAKENSLKFTSDVFFNDGVVYLNSTNAFNIGKSKSGIFNSQANSTFKICNFNQSGAKSESDVSGAYSSSEVDLHLNAKNEIGVFDFYPNSKLNIYLNNNTLSVGKFKLIDGTNGSFAVVFHDYQKSRVRIKDMTAEEILALNITDKNGNKLTFDLVPVVENQNKDFWLDGIMLSKQPNVVKVHVGNSVNFFVSVSGGSSCVEFKWQESIDGGNTWSDIVGASSALYSTPIIKNSKDVKLYRCVVRDGDMIIHSNATTVQLSNESLKKIYVSHNGDNSDGKTWASAFTNLQRAIEMCSGSQAEIWVKGGTYTFTKTIKLNTGVKIIGGFNGSENSLSERKENAETIFDAQNKCGMIEILSAVNKISDITFKNSGTQAITGNGNSIVENCKFINCNASGNGGAICLDNDGVITIRNCEFINCATQWSGGALYVKNGAMKVENCYFEGCNSLYAGALHSNNSAVEIINSTFYKNYSNRSEEILHFANRSTAQIKYCTMQQHPDYNGCAIEIDVSYCKTYNTIMINNNYRSVVQLANSSIFESYNCIVDYKLGDTDIISTDVKLNTPDYYGGNVKTISVEAGSVAIESAKVIEGITTDARGYLRSSTTPTIGAYEHILLPSIINQPKSFEVLRDSDISLSVSASGENLTYQWYFNGVVIEGATETTLNLTNIQLSQAGLYYCVVSNQVGSVQSSVAEVVVRESMLITSHPQNTQSYTGYYTTLSVSATGYDLKYQWQKLIDGKWVDIVGATSSTYNISNLNESDSGEYRCVVSNGGGSVASETSKLTVLKTSKIKITQQPVAIPTAVDDDTELSVSASGGGIYYQWQVKNGKVWEDVSGATSSTLELENLQAKDNNKEYRCILKNDISTATSKTAKLVVVSEPTYTIDTKKHVPEVAIIKGKKNKATFAIKSTKPKGETGTYKYQWYKNGEPIAKATKATYTTDVLTEADFELNPDDNIYYSKDVYYCVISVDVKKQIITSKKTENFKVMKLEPAKILVNPVDVLVSDKEDAIFTAEATKTSGVKAVYQWQVCAFGSDPENPKSWKNSSKGKTLTIKKATVKLSGNLYRCQVYNDLNKKDPHTSTYAKLEVKGTPIIKTQPKAITTYQGLDLELMALVSGYDLTYQWQVSANGKTDWETLSDDDFLLLLEDIESTFFYRFVAYNDENEVVSSKSAKVTVKAKVEVQGLEVLQNKLPVEVNNYSAKVVSTADVVLSVSAIGDSPKYEWQVSDNGANWTPIKSGTKKTYTIKKTNLIAENGKMFRCKVYNGTGKIGTSTYVGTEDFSDAIMIILK